MPNPQERPTLCNIPDHAFFTRGVAPGFIPVSTRDASPISSTSHLSPLISQANLACRLDGEVLPSTPPNTSLLSLARQPLMVAPAGGTAGSGAGTGTFSVSPIGDSGACDAAFWLCNSFIDHSSSHPSNPSPRLSSSAVSCSLFPTFVCICGRPCSLLHDL
jgi:hypothetical protein